MSKNEISLKPISDLLTESFYIPGYQRGYRWSKRQVTDLLNDIKEFQKETESKPRESFYCLQPIVVRATANEKEWELIDGQQRVTTIYIIMQCLKETLAAAFGMEPYRLRYETREDSWSFLQAIDLTQNEKNIDYFHICSAYEAVRDWFADQHPTYKVKFLQTLLNDDESGKNVKVIWYNVRETIDPVDVFTRLNIGKIPLTSAELIKALFLRSRNFQQGEVTLQQLRIAQEWDAIEKSLQADDFWYFLNNSNQYANRIEFILHLIAGEFGNAADAVNDPYFAFIAFSRKLAEPDADPLEEWVTVKRHFMLFEEWYNDRHFFHLIGFLINQEEPISKIHALFVDSKTKSDFRGLLKSLVFYKLFRRDNLREMQYADIHKLIEEKIGELTYGSDRIRPVLLLFNIVTLLRSRESNARFQFDSYKKEYWDIEHVRSVSSGMPNKADLQKKWLAAMVQYFTGTEDAVCDEAIVSGMPEDTEFERQQKEALLKARSLLDGKVFDTEGFYQLYQFFVDQFGEGDERETDNSIGNLALLDSTTNRSYKNAVFPVKRVRILAHDKSATFVPICTKNVFLKYYSHRVDQMMFWGEEDRDQYQNAIVDFLLWFFSSNEEDIA